MLVKACLSTMKVCKRSFHHCRSLLKNVLAILSAGKDSKLRFSRRGRLLMLVKVIILRNGPERNGTVPARDFRFWAQFIRKSVKYRVM